MKLIPNTNPNLVRIYIGVDDDEVTEGPWPEPIVGWLYDEEVGCCMEVSTSPDKHTVIGVLDLKTGRLYGPSFSGALAIKAFPDLADQFKALMQEAA